MKVIIFTSCVGILRRLKIGSITIYPCALMCHVRRGFIEVLWWDVIFLTHVRYVPRPPVF